MKVLISGSARENALGRMCKRGFDELGHEVQYSPRKHHWIPGLRYLIAQRNQDSFINSVSQFNPDLILVIKGSSLPSGVIEKAKEKSGAVLVNWYPDNPYQHRSKERIDDAYLDTLNKYDYVFTWGDFLIEQIKDDAGDSVYHLPFGFDPELHKPENQIPKYSHDIIFLGHWSKKRQDVLSWISNYNLAIYGNGWFRKCKNLELRSCYQGSALTGQEYAQAMSSAKIVLNIVAEHNIPGHNMRTFEVPATGSFMMTTRTSGQKRYFEDGLDVAMFEDRDELRTLISYYLQNDRVRERIASNGRSSVKGHSYTNRVQKMMEVID